MFYFVPSWYNTTSKWGDNTPLWFRVFEQMTFDDTVNQLKMFYNVDEPSCAIILNYQPQLRYFLHKQDLIGLPYWSFFDDIQNIHRTEVQAIDFKSLNWPPKTTFVYTPFIVIAKHEGKILAYINFAENGNLLDVDFRVGDQKDLTYQFDDRGFLSSILYYQNGVESHRDYLNENGVWQVREHLTGDKQIEVNLFADFSFGQRYYVNWEQLLEERLTLFSKEVLEDSDHLVIASNPQHNQLIMDNFPSQDKIFSFYHERDVTSQLSDLKKLHEIAKFFVVDTESMESTLRDAFHQNQLSDKTVMRISPFDTRLRLGHSQNVKELRIHFFIDSISKTELFDNIETILGLMENNRLIYLDLVTYDRNYPIKQVKDDITEMIASKFHMEKFVTDGEDSGENKVDGAAEELDRVTLNLFTNENQVIKALDSARLVIDLGRHPNLYTQIASISAGVPQINAVKTECVSHKENGWILADDKELSKAIHYYFDGLKNWNHSLVFSVQKMADYTSGRILEQWKALLER